MWWEQNGLNISRAIFTVEHFCFVVKQSYNIIKDGPLWLEWLIFLACAGVQPEQLLVTDKDDLTLTPHIIQSESNSKQIRPGWILSLTWEDHKKARVAFEKTILGSGR